MTIPLFLRLRRLLMILSLFFQSKNRMSIGLDLVLLCFPVWWATSMSLALVGMLILWLKIARTFNVQLATVSFLSSGTLNTRRFHFLEYCCRSFSSLSFCLFHNTCDSFVNFLQRQNFRLKSVCLYFSIEQTPLQLLNFLHEHLGHEFNFIPHLLHI